MEVLSYILSVVSIIFYSIVYVPQIHEIYKTQITDGMSTYMLLLWNQADCLSLIATILLKLPLGTILLGWYHAFTGFVMLSYVLYVKYKHIRLERYEILYTILFYVINYSVAISLNVRLDLDISETVGLVIGSITMCLYIIGRLPQIYLNYKRKKTEGLSVLMFIFTILGNVFYVGSVLAYSLEQSYIIKNIPWLIGTFITVSLDIAVMYQCYLFRESKQGLPI